MSAVARIGLFVNSYSPLFVLLAIARWHDSHKAAVAFAAIGLVSFVFLPVALRALRSSAVADRVVICHVRRRREDVAVYVVAYLLPFLALPMRTGEDLVAMAVIFILLGVLYVRSNLQYLNPVLMLFSYKNYDVAYHFEGQDGMVRDVIVASRPVIITKTTIGCFPIADGFLIAE